VVLPNGNIAVVGYSDYDSVRMYDFALAIYDEETKQYWVYKKVVSYKTVIEYKTIQEAFTKWVIEYDHCYKPVKVKKTFYRDVEVPVKKQIPVVTWVKHKVYENTYENGY